MRPTFETSHVAGVLLLVVTMAWGAMGLAKAGSTRECAAGSAGEAGGSPSCRPWPPRLPCSTWPRTWSPRPRSGPPSPLPPGVVILAGGLVLRGWSIMTLGEYFTGRVMVSADQPVITAGPYRVLRHLSYFGFLLCCAGAGLASAN